MNLVPHELHVTCASSSSGWIPTCMRSLPVVIAYSRKRRAPRGIPRKRPAGGSVDGRSAPRAGRGGGAAFELEPLRAARLARTSPSELVGVRSPAAGSARPRLHSAQRDLGVVAHNRLMVPEAPLEA